MGRYHAGHGRERLCADARQRTEFDFGHQHRYARRKIIGCGARRRAHDQPVSPIPERQAAVDLHADLQCMHAGAPVEQQFVQRGDPASIHQRIANLRAVFQVELTLKDFFQRGQRVGLIAIAQVSQMAAVDDPEGLVYRMQRAHGPQHGAVPAQHDDDIGVLRLFGHLVSQLFSQHTGQRLRLRRGGIGIEPELHPPFLSLINIAFPSYKKNSCSSMIWTF